jgi:serine/threonine-protein kinase
VTNPAGTAVPREARDFGNYELVAKLATGGMAEIFLARRTDPVGRGDLVVIKRILPHLADDEHFVTMFRDEAALASKLEHPNVCRVYTLGQSDNTWFIVMEYLHGVALSRLLTRLSKQRQYLSLPLVAAIVVQACEGLHHAHELKDSDGHLLSVVHRDVSPPNIFIGADGVVKLLDFGIAKARGASSKTRTGTVKGKNAYMSPEQILGKPLDRRSDVFALGAVLYELLAVKRLFHRDSDFLTFKAITEEPIPDIRERRPDLPAGMREVVLRALARDVNARYPTAKEMADAVRAAVATGGGVGKVSDLAKMVSTDFHDELTAKQQLSEQAPAATIGADSATVPTLAVTSGQHAAVAPTVVDRPQKRTGNQQAARSGDLATPPPTPRRTPPPIPGSTPPPPPPVEVAPPTPPSQPQMIAMPPAAMIAAPLAPVSATGQLTTGESMSMELSTDLFADRRRAFVIKAAVGAGLALLAVVALIVATSGDDPKPAAVPADAAVEEEPDVVVKPSTSDAGVNKDDIIAISKFGYFSISADEMPTVIFIDDQRIGVTPLTRLPLAPGPHKVKAVGPGKRQVKKFDITIFGGKDTDWGTIDW